jgi:hypothetical protein
MKMRQLLGLCAAIVLLLSAVPFAVAAEYTTPPFTEWQFEWLKYTIENGFGYREDRDVINGYLGDGAETLVFPSEIGGKAVKGIEGAVDMMFFGRDYPEIRRIVIPEGVRYVGRLWLDQLPNLAEIVLPSSLCRVEERAFWGAARNVDITVSPNVTLIVGGNPFAETVTIHGEKGSYVEGFAQHYGLTFEPIVHAPSAGDVNGDGVCNSTDARVILQHTVGKTVLAEEAAPFADVNGDGEADSTDARLCLQYAVGKDVEAAIAVPVTLAVPDAISANAKVYVEVQYPFTLNDGRTIEKREKEEVAHPAAAIREANRILSTSYRLNEGNYLSIPTLEITFVNPNGTTVKFQKQRDAVAHLYGMGDVYNGVAITTALLEAVDI